MILLHLKGVNLGPQRETVFKEIKTLSSDMVEGEVNSIVMNWGGGNAIQKLLI